MLPAAWQVFDKGVGYFPQSTVGMQRIAQYLIVVAQEHIIVFGGDAVYAGEIRHTDHIIKLAVFIGIGQHQNIPRVPSGHVQLAFFADVQHTGFSKPGGHWRDFPAVGCFKSRCKGAAVFKMGWEIRDGHFFGILIGWDAFLAVTVHCQKAQQCG